MVISIGQIHLRAIAYSSSSKAMDRQQPSTTCATFVEHIIFELMVCRLHLCFRERFVFLRPSKVHCHVLKAQLPWTTRLRHVFEGNPILTLVNCRRRLGTIHGISCRKILSISVPHEMCDLDNAQRTSAFDQSTPEGLFQIEEDPTLLLEGFPRECSTFGFLSAGTTMTDQEHAAQVVRVIIFIQLRIFFVMEIKHKNRCSFFPNINTRLNNIHTSSLFKTLIAHSPTLTLHAGLLPSLFQITCTFGTIFHFLCVVPYPLMQQSWWRLRLCLKRTICEPRSGYSTDRT